MKGKTLKSCEENWIFENIHELAAHYFQVTSASKNLIKFIYTH